MSEQVSTQAAGQLANATTQPGQQVSQQALSQPQIDPNEFARYKREAERARGMQGYYDAGKKYGIERPEQLDEIGTLHKTLKEQGISPSQVAQLFGKQIADVTSDPSSLSKADIEKIVGERLTKMEADMARKAAESQHSSLIEAEYEELSEAKIKAILGDDAPAELIEMAKYAAIGRYGEQRSQYDESHPLKGMFGPAGRDGLGKITGWIKDTATKLKASQSLALGAAVRKTASSTPAGNVAGQGKPSNEPERSGGLPSRHAVEALAAQLRAKRGQ